MRSAGERVHLRSALVVSEFALAVMLVIGAALLIQSFWRLAPGRARGSTPHGVLKAEYQLPPDRYPVDFRRFPDFAEMHAFSHGLLARAAALPGVRARRHRRQPSDRSRLHELVLGRRAGSRVALVPRDVDPAGHARLLRDDGRAAGARPAAARRRLDDGAGGAAGERGGGAAVLRDADPIGKQIRFWGALRTVVGVVGNERFHGLADAAPPAVYTPLDQAPSANGAGVLLVRVDGATGERRGGGPRGAFGSRTPALAVFGLEPLDETLARSVAERRFTMLVLGLLAAVALVLAAIGIHGVLSYTVGQRTREIGIRVALGAHPGRLRRLVMFEGMRLACVGAVLGVADGAGAEPAACGPALRRRGDGCGDVHRRPGGAVRRRARGQLPAGAPGDESGSDQRHPDAVSGIREAARTGDVWLVGERLTMTSLAEGARRRQRVTVHNRRRAFLREQLAEHRADDRHRQAPDHQASEQIPRGVGIGDGGDAERAERR